VLAFLCLGNILYVGLVAIRQKDLNRLIGNSSVAHMGFAFLGIASLSLIGLTGAVVVMVAHGLLAALTFALSGYLYQQTKTLEMAELGGLLRQLPFIGTALVMAAFAGCGLPGFANFAGEVLVFFGAWKGLTAITIFAAWGALIIGAVYMLRAVRTILQGPAVERWNNVRDASDPWRRLPFALLLASLLLFGVAPRLLTDRIQPSTEAILKLTTAPGTPAAKDIRTAQAQPANIRVQK
jgi:NADH-quinone oxidoreductase subunit M